ncbi:PilN domain-containing protein [Aggregatilinea lenta]|uniref:PilN domain-containing protein n=1 Tax=Aggregatilinea lenta TaxID=913108 RepID=UPI000E5A2800|nr:PilN domain-containing protein [Aggregatilinea lenta]
MTLPAPVLDGEVEEEVVQGSRLSTVIRWLVVLSIGALFVPLVLLSTTIAQSNETLSAELATSQSLLENAPPESAAERSLSATLSQKLEDASAIDTVQTSLTNNQVIWPVVMASLGNYNENYMILLDVSQTGQQIMLSGRAWTEPTVISYVNRLESSGLFTRVSVQSLAVTTAPEATAAPAAETTATPQPRVSRFTLANPNPGVRYIEFVALAELKSGDS